MTTSAEHVAAARQSRDELTAYMEARWAGVAAMAEGLDTCPFGEAELVLAVAYHEGLAMALRQRLRTANAVRPARAAASSYVYRTAPKD